MNRIISMFVIAFAIGACDKPVHTKRMYGYSAPARVFVACMQRPSNTDLDLSKGWSDERDIVTPDRAVREFYCLFGNPNGATVNDVRAELLSHNFYLHLPRPGDTDAELRFEQRMYATVARLWGIGLRISDNGVIYPPPKEDREVLREELRGLTNNFRIAPHRGRMQLQFL